MCREGICGSCAMNIDGVNGLACLTKVGSRTQGPSWLLARLVHSPHAAARCARAGQPAQRSAEVVCITSHSVNNIIHPCRAFRRLHTQCGSNEVAAPGGAGSEQGVQNTSRLSIAEPQQHN